MFVHGWQGIALADGLASPIVQKVFLGFDFGGSGIKAASVDVTDGSLQAKRVRLETPDPSSPDAVATTILSIAENFDTEGTVGIGVPAIVEPTGEVHTAMNIHSSWVGANARSVFSEALGREVAVINDADAAAVAELEFGAAKGVKGTVVVLTFGTGIGSGVLVDGVLARNVELGVLELDGHWPAEKHFSAKARRREDLSWETWGKRADRYLGHINRVFSPTLIVVGGGMAKRWDRYSNWLDEDLPAVPATLGNDAGLIGAAVMAARQQTG